MIKIDQVVFRYPKGQNNVLSGVDAVFDTGKIHVLLGLNGSGKTTLIKILAGLYQPISGKVFYGDDSLKNISIRERAKRMAYVAQRSDKIDDFSVMDYLLFGTANQAKFYQAPNEEAKEKVIGIADRFGIGYLLKKDLGGISGGERQIVSIASSIAQDTSIILLDEPTSALDICNQYKVLSVLKEIAEKENKTIVLSTHNPNHALYLGAEVYLLNRGVIVDHGTATDIVRPEKLKPVYGEKIGYCRDLPYDEISFSESFQGSKFDTQ